MMEEKLYRIIFESDTPAGKAFDMVFLFTLVTLVILSGSIMYLGDISPQTPFGQFLASCFMILGYAIIAVPTGIFSAEFIRADTRKGSGGE